MKKLLIAATLSGLFAAGAALAQDHHDEHGHPGGGHGPGPAPHAGGAPHASHVGGGHMGGNMGGPAHRDASPRPAAAMAGPSAAMRGPAMTAAPARAPAAGRTNFSAYHRNFTAPRHYHTSPYRQPPGFYAHRWTFGEQLPQAFWARDYWLLDFADFGLMPPPPGTVWVRVGDDALLIDEYSGEVIQVEYGVFY